MSDPNALPIAGWYPDPEDDKGDRWWNGATWSDHRRPRNAGPGWAPTKKKSTKAAAAAAVATPAAAPAAPADGVAPVPVPAPAAAGAPGIPAPGPVVNPYAGAQPAPQYAPYAPAYAPNYVPAQPMRNPLALAGMITSLVGLLFNWIIFGAPGIVGAIISFIGLRKANQLAREGVTVGNGKAMAITGIVSGLVGAFLFDLFYFTTWSPLIFQ
jgi:hypothetical protein